MTTRRRPAAKVGQRAAPLSSDRATSPCGRLALRHGHGHCPARGNVTSCLADIAMDIESPSGQARPRFELRYRSLSPHRCGYAFPCDADGEVDLDALSEEARDNYLYARAMVGFELLQPEVRAAQ